MNHLTLAVTAAAVAAAFGLHPASYVRAEAGASLEDMQNRLIELTQNANNVKAKAEAEKRDLTADERADLDQIFAAFDELEGDIEREQRIADLNAKMSTPTGRKTTPAVVEATETRAQADARPARAAMPAVPKDHRETGKWGFRSQGEYLSAVVKASQRGAAPDPRLIANAPTTYGSEGVGADGGFAVPPDFRTAIVQKVMAEDSLLGRTDVMTTTSNSITVPTDETTPWQSTGGILAYWESEAGQKTQSKPSLTEKQVKANKLIALVPITDELLEDAPSMASYVNSKAPVKMDFKVNDAIINGSGVGQPLGILNSAGTVSVSAESGQTADTLRFENINNMWFRLYAPSRRNAVWLMNADAEAQLPYMKFIDQGSGNAVPVYMPPGGVSGAPYSTLYGRPIIVTEAMPALGDAGDVILADMSKYMSVMKAGGVRSDVSIHLFFDYDVTAFRFVMRVGGQPWYNAPIERTGSQSNRGFFVSLGARA
jgi:HK97 family phage major capsid protein